jgi:hypothetical protein
MTLRNKIKALMCTGLGVLAFTGAVNAAAKVVISQVYASGGNSGAAYQRDYIELFNAGDAPQDLSGWSVQYGSATGNVGSSASLVQALSGSIPAGGYILVAGASGNNANTTPPGLALPTPDVNNTPAAANMIFPGLNLGGGGGKVALVTSTTPLNVSNPVSPTPAAGLIDFVGYGTANAFEGSSAAPAPSAANSLFRANAGCTDSGQNGSDFATAAAAPRNSATAIHICMATGTGPSGSNSTTTTNTCAGTNVAFSVTVVPGTNSTITSVVGDFTAIGGTTGVALSNGGSGLVYSTTQTVNAATTAGVKNIPVVITDGAGLTGNATISITIDNCNLRLTTGTNVSPSGVCRPGNVTFTAVVRPGGVTPPGPSTGITVTLDLINIGGSFGVPMTFQNVDMNGNSVFTYTFAVPADAPTGTGIVNVSIADAQGRTATGTYNVGIADCTNSSSSVVISQVYGGGGNAGATYTNDYVELFNRSNATVDISGWTIQYASASGDFNNFATLGTGLSIAPGKYFLVQLASNAAVGVALPTPDAMFTSPNLSGTDGKVILASGTTTALGALGCPLTVPSGVTIQDFVAYGSTSCFEGAGSAPGLSSTTAAFRASNGCQDFDQNGVDFSAAAAAPRNSATAANTCGGPVNIICCLPGNNCSSITASLCTSSGGTVQTGATSCTPSPCAVASNVCCRGTTCVITSGTCTAPSGVGVSSSAGATCNASGSNTSPCCYSDFNKDGNRNIDDIFIYLNAWFGTASNPYTKIGGDGVANANIDDLFVFINVWFAGGCG